MRNELLFTIIVIFYSQYTTIGTLAKPRRRVIFFSPLKCKRLYLSAIKCNINNHMIQSLHDQNDQIEKILNITKI